MKIRQIRFKNINSFYGEHEPISFSEGILAQTGLFIIAGPTGAGKSTLLDVITLALFNRVPRVTEGDGRGLSKEKMLAEGLIINQKAASEPKTDVYAEVEYELNGQAYRSRWSIEKNRNGNWNDYDMEVARLPDGQILSNKKRDVPELNVKNIGLTYEQFIRSMVLAQGAFDKFLKASSADRSKLLEQITGTEIYRRLSQRAHIEHKNRAEELKWRRQEVGAVQLLPDEKIAELMQQQADLKRRLDELTGELEVIRTDSELLKKIAQEDEHLITLGKQAHDLTRSWHEFAPRAERLANHQRVADLAGILSDLANTARSRERAEKDRKATDEVLCGQQETLNELLAKARNLIQQPTLTVDELAEQVNQFRDQVLALSERINNERNNAKKPHQRLQTLVKGANDPVLRQLDLNDIPKAATLVGDRKRNIATHLSRLTTDYPTVTPESARTAINDLRDQQQAIVDLIRLREDQQQRLIDGMNLNQRVAEQQKISADESRMLAELDQAFTRLEQDKEAIQQQKTRLDQEASVEKLRESLQDGNPCPLCGSLHHPYAHDYVQQAGNLELHLRLATDDLEAKRRERDAAKGRLISAQTIEETSLQQVADMRILYKEKKQEIAKKLTEAGFDESYTPEVLKDVLKLVAAQSDELNELQQCWAHQEQLSQIETEITVYLESKLRLDQLKQEKEDMYAGDDIKERCAQLLERFYDVTQRMATQRGLREKADADSDKFAGEYAEFLNTLQPLLQQRGFADADAARACLLDAGTLHKLTQEQQQLNDRSQTIDIKTKQTTQTRQRALDARLTALPAQTVSEQLVDLSNEQRRKSEQIGHIKAQLKSDSDQRKQHDKLLKKLGELERQAEPWRELDQLIGSAKGDEFSRFAQGLTLTQLIALANRRLRDLSDRYLLLKPRDGQDELYVLDQYQGGAERSVTSLSGGETFTLSLALALALSDLASQNVQIDSLFVDEGFGTLDPETLDTAIVMLEKLQQESQKTIGIISHRQEIKERISVQVQVEKGTDGNSRVNIVEL